MKRLTIEITANADVRLVDNHNHQQQHYQAVYDVLSEDECSEIVRDVLSDFTLTVVPVDNTVKSNLKFVRDDYERIKNAFITRVKSFYRTSKPDAPSGHAMSQHGFVTVDVGVASLHTTPMQTALL